MFDISSSGIMELTRGDSVKVPLFINQGSELQPVRYTLTENDVLYFAILEPNQSFEEALVKKVYTCADEMTETQDLYIKILPRDTQNLIPGRYYYTAKLKQNKANGEYEVHTVIPETELFLLR